MAENFKCSGNCLNCMPAQRAYCASQHAYSNMKVLDNVMALLMAMQGDMRIMKEKVEAMQNNEAMLFDPSIPQSGDGGENRSPETNKI